MTLHPMTQEGPYVIVTSGPIALTGHGPRT